MGSNSGLETSLEKVTQEFVAGLPEKVGAIESAWVSIWRNQWHPDDVQNLINSLHKISGAAASLGFEQITRAANEFQILLQSICKAENRESNGKLIVQAESQMESLRTALYTDQQIDLTALTQTLGISKSLSTSLQDKRATRLIYLVEDDPIQSEELAEQIGFFGYSVLVFHDTTELEGALKRAYPLALLMDVIFPAGKIWGFEAIANLRNKFPDLPPVIFLTVNDHAACRLQAVRVGGEAYFTKPVDVGVLVDVLDRLVLHDAIPPYRVLVVDDSRLQANYISLQLNNAGIVAEIVSDPLKVIDHMIVFNPDLLLLDMYMPGCTGMELAKLIRQMEQFISVPIVFLSTEMDKEKQLAAMGHGGDDFLTKPIEPEHLISAVNTRIKRYRKLRSLMVQDSLTGLLNHSTTKDRLINEVERASRQNIPLSFAMIDIDHFKLVNDSHGHSTGDRVLKSLAYLLKQRLRKTDIIGRIGGEEFAIIMPETGEELAVQVMNDLCQGFAKVRHYTAEQEFSVTFSCGVASIVDFNSADSLTKAADQSLYAAKAAGRNRVVCGSEIDGNDKVSPSENEQPHTAHPKHSDADISRTLACLSSLNRISQTIMNRKELSVIVTDVTCELKKLFNAHHVGLSLITPDRTTLEFIGNSQEGWNLLPNTANRVYLLNDLASKEAVETGKAVLVQDAMNNPRTRDSHEVLKTHGINSRIIVPLLVRGQTIGTMNLDFLDVNLIFSATDFELAETIAGTIASVIDNSRLFADLEKQNEYYESLVRNIPAAVITIDLEAKITSWNPAAENLFGYREEEVLGKNIDDLLASEEYRQEAIQYNRKIQESLEPIHTFTQRKHRNGALLTVELLAVPILIKGVYRANLAIYHDITELERTRLDAEAANKAKSAFLATMSHEIRTPLNAIVGMTTLLLDSRISNKQREFTETIRNSSDALLGIINDILDFSKIEAGKLELEEQAFDLRECIESALDLVAATANNRGIDLAYILDPAVPNVIVGDSTRLRQILLNLLSNSLKFTDVGEVVLSVTAEKPQENNGKAHQLHFLVRDTGIGIPAEQIPRLFRSFSQLDASTTRKYGGTGLGLAISKRLTELMKGEMWVESEGIPGKGATFHFTIRAEHSTSPVPKFMNVRQPELSGKRVLVVDDNATNRYLLVRQVQSWGMHPQETADPKQALLWIREGQKFDLALLDMQMPEMDGVTLAAEISRCYQGEPELPMIMLTSLEFRESDHEGVKFAAYLTKPIKPAVLYTKVMEVFSGRILTIRSHVAQSAVVEANASDREPLRILLAEDIVVNQKVALLLLERIGYKAEVVGNGYEVLEALRRQPYDVILLDIQMPDMDGLEATRKIRSGEWLAAGEDGALEHQPYIIAMTANAMQGDRETYLAAGMDDYISKPVRLEELSRALKLAYAALHQKPPAIPSVGGRDNGREPAVQVIDESEFRKFLSKIDEGNSAALSSLIQVYLDESPQILANFLQAADNGDLKNIRLSMHSLKSSSALFGATRLAELCRTLEVAAQNNADHFTPEVITSLKREFQDVIHALQARLSGQQG